MDQLFPLLVGALERGLMESDLGVEFGPAAAVPPVEVFKLALGCGESLGRALALPVELFLLLGDEVTSVEVV